MASNSADWVRGVARLISSATSTWAKIGPLRNSNWRVSWLKIDTPLTSVGKRSGVHWTRVNAQPLLAAKDRASMVFCDSGHVFEQYVPAGQERRHRGAHGVGLVQHHRFHTGDHVFDGLPEFAHGAFPLIE